MSLFLISLILSLPNALVLWLLNNFNYLDALTGIIIYILGLFLLIPVLYRPYRQLVAIKDFLIRINTKEVYETPKIDSLPYSILLRSGLDNASKMVRTQFEVSQKITTELNILLDKIPMPIIQINSERKVVRQNSSAIELIGEASLGRDLVIALRNPEVIREVDRVIKTKNNSQIALKLGEDIPRNYLCYIICSQNKESLSAILLVFNDITDLIKGEKMRSDFVANASHEIRTPLAVLLGCLETLSGPAKDDKEASERFLKIAADETNRMVSLLDDLLSLSEIEVNQHLVPTEETDIVLGIRRAINGLESHFTLHNKEVEINLDVSNEISTVIADDSELQLVWRNLILNAVKYGDGKVDISVKLEKESLGGKQNITFVRVDVVDYGVLPTPVLS
ncbi:MAG: hypothetical protein CBC47_09915, partial [Alphaproteobacteria bacterium TMED87]